MNFTFIKTLNSTILNSARQQKFYSYQQALHGDDFSLIYDKGAEIYSNSNNELIAVSGYFAIKIESRQNNNQLLFDLLQFEQWPLPERVDGLFSGIKYINGAVMIFNDFIGPFNLFYYVNGGSIVVSTQLSVFAKLGLNEISKAGLFLEVLPRIYTSYGKLTPYKNVLRLLPGQLLSINTDTFKEESVFDTGIIFRSPISENDLAHEMVELIGQELNLSYANINNLDLTLSGGVDSRLLLASMESMGVVPEKILSYGAQNSLDVSIPKAIADKLGVEFESLPINNFQFPSCDLMYDVVEKTDSLYINSWMAFLDYYQNEKERKILLIGDITDLLRAKNISKFKSRKFRTSYFIKKYIFNSKLKFTEITDENLNDFKAKLVNRIFSKAFIPQKFLKFSDKEVMEIKEEISKDIDLLFKHIDNFKLPDLESYEELFGVFTHGRREMGKQLNILKEVVVPHCPLMNQGIAKKILAHHPSLRYADNLTHKMFITGKWYKLGDFPTAQNPFSSYSSNYKLYLLGWFIRSKTDNFLTKVFIKTGGRTKVKRLYSYDDYGAFYNEKGSLEKYINSLTERTDNSYPINLFKSRMYSVSWPISGKDLMPYVQATYYIKNSINY